MRNVVVHDYGNVDFQKIWTTIIDDIPVLKAFCERTIIKIKQIEDEDTPPVSPRP
jgi:uncharacterized protein with HEPN domain